MKTLLGGMQKLGRALMLPIAVLPVAALLLRLGQPDLLNIAAIAAAGEAIFANLGILFAIGVAVGLARENHGAAGLAGIVCYLVATKGAEVLIVVPAEAVAAFTGAAVDLAAKAYRAKELAKLSVPAGIISGLIAGALYNRFSDIRLPAYLAFFAGRRFVPIVSGLAGLLLALAFGWGFPALERGMDGMSRAVLASGEVGLFLYGALNRVLIVTGLHHVLNNLAWFFVGDFGGVTGDLNRFFKEDPTAGAFMSGFFPVMMFGLPAACLAMYRAARPERRAAVGGLLFSMALTSFLTGVTEPIEFAFMFLAPVLYVVHAVLTGLAMVVMDLLSVHLGFGFSAGLFDYVLNFSLATRPLWLLPIGAAYFALYYVVFTFAIRRFNLATPGREPDEDAQPAQPRNVGARAGEGAADWVRALGGARNLIGIDACTTRLRLVVADNHAIDERMLKRLGARGFVRPAAGTLQVVVGPVADQLAGDMRTALRDESAPSSAEPVRIAEVRTPAAALVSAMGGRSNLRSVGVHSTRLVIEAEDSGKVDAAALEAAGFRGVVRVAPATWHVIVGPDAPQAARAMAIRTVEVL